MKNFAVAIPPWLDFNSPGIWGFASRDRSGSNQIIGNPVEKGQLVEMGISGKLTLIFSDEGVKAAAAGKEGLVGFGRAICGISKTLPP